MKRLVIILLTLLNVSVVYSNGTNLLAPYNGGFENGMANWRFFEVPNNIGSTAEVITDDVAEGLQAIKIIYVADDGTVVDRGFDNWNARVPIVPGAEYTAKVTSKIDSTSDLYLNITLGYFDGNGAVLEQKTKRYKLNTIYSEYSVILTAPSDAHSCWIAFRLSDALGERAEGIMYLDDASLFGESTSLRPRVMLTTLPTNDVPIASVNVMDDPYNAVNDGSADVTSAFQAAIDRASIAGGGVVFVPAGNYRFDGNILMREKVILRGEWQNPEETNNSVVGSILMPYAGQGSESCEAFIRLERGAGVRNLSIWYPNQSVAAVSPYPWTIQCSPETPLGPGSNPSMVNVTFVNPYQAIKIGPLQNELHYIRNVYGTPLKTGIWLSQTTDIGRIMNVHFEPKYWSQSGLSSSPSVSSILDWLQSNATGIVMGRSDWEYIFDVSLVGYQIGVQIIRYSDFGPNGVIYGLNIDKGKVGIELSDVNSIGFAITNSTINVEGENSACVITGDAYNSIVQFNTCTFGGTPRSAIQFFQNSVGRLSFQNCTFENWGNSTTDPAIDCNMGSVSLIGNSFMRDKTHIRLGKDVPNAQILDNFYPTELNIDNSSNGEVIISQEPLDSPKLNIPSHPFVPEKRPVTDDLFIVQDYGAVEDGITDNTSAFQAALDAAGSNGGGTVYIPAGWYRLDGHITVPTGVELRGIWDTPHHTMSMGSVLLVYEGKNDANGTPFISMESNSGVCGFTVWYPEQSTNSFYPYPWSIQALGNDCWIKNVTLSNPWQGVDFATYPSSGHVVSYLAGSPLKTGISVGQNYTEGWIENVHFNPHYWLRSEGYPMDSVPEFQSLVSHQQNQLFGFNIGDVAKEHVLGTFIFAAKRGINLSNDGVCNVDFFLHGTDAGSNGIYMEASEGTINFVNTQLVLLGTEQQGIITTDDQFGADVSFYNTISWGGREGFTTDIHGNGNLLIQQLHTMNGAFNINGGKNRLENIKVSSRIEPQYIIGKNISSVKLFDSYYKRGFELNSNTTKGIEADYNYNQTANGIKLVTGWEKSNPQNDWDNILWGNKNIVADSTNYMCRAVAVDCTHSGDYALQVLGKKTNNSDSLFFKIFQLSVPVFDSTILTYWLNPQNEMGKSIFIDILFSDGTRLSEQAPIAEDGLQLSSPRGIITEWVKVKCNIGKYASGKYTRSILVGSKSLTGDNMNGYIDDFNLATPIILKKPWQHIDIGQQYFDGYSFFKNDSLHIYSANRGLDPYEDKFVYVYQTLEGECEISAKVESLKNPGLNPYVGVMIRQNDSTLSRFVSIFYSPLLGVYTKWRTPTSNSVHAVVHRDENTDLPKWLKVSRKGNEFNTYTSMDGINWGTPLYHLIIDMDSTVMIGLALISGSTSSWMKTEVSNIIVSDRVVSVKKSFNDLPKTFKLFQNNPNPFNPTTTIKYSLPAGRQELQIVTIKVYDILGREVATLVNKEQKAGNYEVKFEASRLTSGTYYYRIVAGDFVKTMKMILIK